MNKMIQPSSTGSIIAMMCIGLLLINGCAGYRIGSMLPGDVKTVFIPTFINNTDEPLIENEATQKVIARFQQDGSLRVTSEENADAILIAEIIEYRLEPVAFRRDVRDAAQQYRLFLVAKMEMRRTRDQSIVAESPRLIGKTVFDVTGDLSSSKLTANPLAAEDLAIAMVQLVVEYWPSSNLEIEKSPATKVTPGTSY